MSHHSLAGFRIFFSAFKFIFFLLLPYTHSPEQLSLVFFLSFSSVYVCQFSAFEIYYNFVRRYKSGKARANRYLLLTHFSLLSKALIFSSPLVSFVIFLLYLFSPLQSDFVFILFGLSVVLDVYINDFLRYLQIEFPEFQVVVLALRQFFPYLVYLFFSFLGLVNLVALFFFIVIFQLFAVLYCIKCFDLVRFKTRFLRYIFRSRFRVDGRVALILLFRSSYYNLDRIVVSYFLSPLLYNTYSLLVTSLQFGQMLFQTLVIQPKLKDWYSGVVNSVSFVRFVFVLCIPTLLGYFFLFVSRDFFEGYRFSSVQSLLLVAYVFLSIVSYIMAFVYIRVSANRFLNLHIFGFVSFLASSLFCFYFDLFIIFILIFSIFHFSLVIIAEREVLSELFKR